MQSFYPDIPTAENYHIHSRKDRNGKMLCVLKYLTDEWLRLKGFSKTGDVEATIITKRDFS